MRFRPLADAVFLACGLLVLLPLAAVAALTGWASRTWSAYELRRVYGGDGKAQRRDQYYGD
jgi:hypothetical protein